MARLLTLKAFGTLEFHDDACEGVRELQTRPQRSALLAYLVLAHHGRYCRRDTLLSLFWPECDSEQGRHALSQALTFVRRHVGSGVLITRGVEEIGVDPAAVRSDVQTFRDAVARQDWEAALASYGGDLLEGLHVEGAAPFVDWVDRERERLRESAADAAWRHAHGLIAGGRLTDAERAAQQALWLVPTSESAVRDFIQALAAAGDRAAALGFYDKFVSILRQVLELEPAPETQAVAREVRNGDIPATTGSGPKSYRTSSDLPAAPANGAADPAPRRQVVPRLGAVLGVMGAVVVGVAGIAAAYLLRAPGLGEVTPTEIRPVSSEPGVEYLPAISPDGRNVAFVRDGRIVVRSVEHVPGQGEVLMHLDPGSNARFPTWTADGERVRFLVCGEFPPCYWHEGNRTGGTTRRVAVPAGIPPDHEGIVGWSEDDAQVAFFRGDTLFVADGVGQARPIFLVDPKQRRFGRLHSLAWSPDRQRIAFVNGRHRATWPGDIDPASIWVVELETGTGREVAGGEASNLSPVWLDDRHLLFASNRNGPRGLYLMEVDDLAAPGDPHLVPGVADPHTLSYSRASGRLAWSRFTTDRNVRSYPLDAPTPTSLGDGEPVTEGNQLVWSQDVSRDGKWIVYDSDLVGNADLYKMALPGGEVVRLTDSPRDDLSPRWSPDGKEIAYTATPAPPERGQFEVFVMSADGGAPIQVTKAAAPGHFNVWPTWAPDGRSLAFTANGGGTGNWDGGWVTTRDSLSGDWSEPERLAFGQFMHGEWAPDGHSLVVNPRGAGDVICEIDLKGDTIWRRHIAATSSLRSFAQDMQVRSSVDGRTLYSRGYHKDGTLGVWAIPDWGRGEPRLVVVYDNARLAAHYLSVGPDRLYLTVERNESDIWVADLKR